MVKYKMWRLIRGAFFMLALAGCAAGGVSGRGLRLPPGMAVGDISGPGAEMVGRALKSRTTPADGTAEASVLSGRVSFTPAVSAEKEIVPGEVSAGRPVLNYR
ncbi:MAG: hypothetical protein LBV21_06780, partial [Candidatus Adiutrix sp.]|nr:hypothetical protein [Candidatus Adiutrix sp.]